MSQGVIIALLVLAGLLVLRLTNSPPFSSTNPSQSSTQTQTTPTPITRSTGFSSSVATASSSQATPIDSKSPPSNDPSNPGNPTDPPVRGNW